MKTQTRIVVQTLNGLQYVDVEYFGMNTHELARLLAYSKAAHGIRKALPRVGSKRAAKESRYSTARYNLKAKHKKRLIISMEILHLT
jgi:hypothetical protein